MNEKVSVIILSGGQGRRFGLVDKGLIPWQGKPLITHVIEKLQPQSDQILLNCNRNFIEYQTFGFELCPDFDDQQLGPLAGAQAAASQIAHPWCLLCPNDTPKLPSNLIEALLNEIKDQKCQIVYPVCGDRHHYLPALIRSELLPSITRYLESGGRSLRGWYQKYQVSTVNFSENEENFANINSPQALEALENGLL